MRPWLCWLLLLWPAASFAASPVPKDLYAQVDHGLRPATVLADPEAYRGRTLLLGGTVERTVSDPGSVLLTVVCQRLDDQDRPGEFDPTLGRIVAFGQGLDGARLQPGRQVTLVGVVAGWSGAAADRLAQLQIRFVHPWPTPAEIEAARPPDSVPGYGCDPWYDGPWCNPWYYGPYPRWRFDFGYYRHWH